MRLLTDNRPVNFADRLIYIQPVVQRGYDDARPGIADVKPGSIGFPVYRWRDIVSPFNLGLIGLAVAVALWGFAYKLSLYHPDQSSQARMSVAKMWLGPEGTSLISKGRPESRLHYRSSRDTVSVEQVEAPPEIRNRILAVSYAAVPGRECLSVCTPRSPPAHIN
jgi:hypothetical protein